MRMSDQRKKRRLRWVDELRPQLNADKALDEVQEIALASWRLMEDGGSVNFYEIIRLINLLSDFESVTIWDRPYERDLIHHPRPDLRGGEDSGGATLARAQEIAEHVMGALEVEELPSNTDLTELLRLVFLFVSATVRSRP